jgi:hypothetical protein
MPKIKIVIEKIGVIFRFQYENQAYLTYGQARDPLLFACPS